MSTNNIRTKPKEEKPVEGNDTVFRECSTENEISCINENFDFIGDYFTLSFISKSVISDVEIIGEATLQNYTISNNRIDCEIIGLLNEGAFNIKFMNASTHSYCSVFYYKDSSQTTHISLNSLEHAKGWNKPQTPYQPNTNQMSSSNGLSGPTIRVPDATEPMDYLTGKLQWLDDENQVHPLVGAKISVTVPNGPFDCYTTTNAIGEYYFAKSTIRRLGSGNPTIHILTENENIKIKYETTYELDYVCTPKSNGKYVFNYTFSPVTDGNLGKAIIIFQAARSFSNFAKSQIHGEKITKCDFVYPSDSDKTSYYHPATATVYISGRLKNSYTSAGYIPTSYQSFDVIGHEYGHHVMTCLGISNNGAGGYHAFGHSDYDLKYEEAKELGKDITGPSGLTYAKSVAPLMVWNESLNTFWSTIAQKSFAVDLKRIPTVGDTFYTAYNGVIYDLNPYNCCEPEYEEFLNQGEGSETNVQIFLYKLTSPESDDYDKLYMPFDELWNLVVENRVHTFGELLDQLYKTNLNKHDIGLLLSRFNMCTSYISVENYYLNALPTFTWSTETGFRIFTYSEFDLYFLDENMNEIFTKYELINPKSCLDCDYTFSYTLSQTEWESILNSSGFTYYVYVVSRQCDFDISNDYISNIFAFGKPVRNKRSVQIKAQDWGFKEQYYFYSQTSERINSYDSSDTISINTDRLRCGYIDNSYVVLSPKRQKAGSAYFSMTFDKPVSSYTIQLALWSNNEQLTSANCTASLEVMNNEGHWLNELDLINDITLHSKDVDIENVSFSHSEGIYGIRIVMTSPATGSHNKCRLCINDIYLNV